MGQALEKPCAPCQNVGLSVGRVLLPGRENIPDTLEHPSTLPSGGEQGARLSTASDGSGHGHTQPVFAIWVYASGTRALTASGDGTVKVWDLATYTVRHTLSGGHGGAAVHAVCAFGSGHTRALSGGADHAIRVWDLEHHTLLGPPVGSSSVGLSSSGSANNQGHSGAVLALCPCGDSSTDPGGRATVASGSSDGTIKVWSLEVAARAWGNPSVAATPRLLTTLSGHSGPVRCLAAFGNGTRLLSGGNDGAARVWALDSAQSLSTSSSSSSSACLTVLRGHSGAVNCCAVYGHGAHSSPNAGKWSDPKTSTRNGNGSTNDSSSSKGRSSACADDASSSDLMGGVRCKRCGMLVGDDASNVVDAIDRHFDVCPKKHDGSGNSNGSKLNGHNENGGGAGSVKNGKSSSNAGNDDASAAGPWDRQCPVLALTGSSDETLRLWDVGRKCCVRVLLGHFESVTCCAVYSTPRALNDSSHNNNALPSSSYALVLSGSLDETLKVWPLSYERPSSLTEKEETINSGNNSISFPATSSESLVDCGVEFADGAESGVQNDTSNEDGEEQRGSFVGEGPLSPDEHPVPSSSGVGAAVAAAQFTEEPLTVGCRHTMAGHEAGVTACVAFEDGTLALSGSFDRTLKVWDVPDR